MLCAIHANQSIAKKMKADPDEMTENPDEGLQVPKNYLEVFTDGPATKPEVSAPTQAEMEKVLFYHSSGEVSHLHRQTKCFHTKGSC